MLKWNNHNDKKKSKIWLAILPVVAAMVLVGTFPAGVAYAADQTETPVIQEQETDTPDETGGDSSSEENTDSENQNDDTTDPSNPGGDSSETGSGEEEIKNGWVDEEDGRYYYVDGEKVVDAIQTIEEEDYCFDEDGLVKTGLFDFEGKTYYANEDGVLLKDQMLTETDSWYYLGADGAALINTVVSYNGAKYIATANGVIRKTSGETTLNGKVYYTKSDGRLYVNEAVPNGSNAPIYYMDGNGNPTKGKVFAHNGAYYFANTTDGKVYNSKRWIDFNGKKYYAGDGGKLYRNQTWSGKYTYYFGSDCAMVKGAILKLNGKTVYARKSDGGINTVYGKIELNGKIYFSKDGGQLYINEIVPDRSGDPIYYMDGNGNPRKGVVFYYKGNYYYARRSDGGVNYGKGWIDYNGKKYYSPPGGKLYRNRTWSGKNTYYFGNDAAMVKGAIIKLDGDYYYLRKSDGGVNHGRGWIDLNGKKYYSPPGGKLYRNQTWSGKNTYYFGNDCAMVKGAIIKLNGDYYYARKSDGGINPATGWFELNGKNHYATTGGRVAYNEWVKIGSMWYHFNTSFVVDKKQSNAPLDAMGQKAQSYSSSTDYLILVDRDDHVVKIYSGSKWNWTQIKSFSCGNGKSSTPTISGEFSIPSKYPRSQPYFDSGSARCWYPTRIYGGYLFHSVLYYPASSPNTIMDGRLGVGVSHGCIRLALGNAKWIYDNIPLGTKVVIY